MFAMVYTRPDICFAIGRLSQFMSDPAEHHGRALKGLLKYLRSIIGQKMRFGLVGAHQKLVVYTDADWASDKHNRKSISRSTTQLCGGTVAYSSRKQRSIATSSTESEYIAAAGAAKQG
jgi:hypothetical protein